MRDNTNTMTRQQLVAILESEKRLGYPTFKSRIAEVMASEFAMDFDEAKQLVFRPDIEKLIDEDIEWAQHMGVHFWAKQIYQLNKTMDSC